MKGLNFFENVCRYHYGDIWSVPLHFIHFFVDHGALVVLFYPVDILKRPNANSSFNFPGKSKICVLEPIQGYSSRNSGQLAGKRHKQRRCENSTSTEENITLIIEVV